jgi:hypothetical protein
VEGKRPQEEAQAWLRGEISSVQPEFNPRRNKGDHPIVNVNWDDAKNEWTVSEITSAQLHGWD